MIIITGVLRTTPSKLLFTMLGCLSPDIIVIYNADQSANILKAIRRNDNQKADYEVSETLRPLYI